MGKVINQLLKNFIQVLCRRILCYNATLLVNQVCTESVLKLIIGHQSTGFITLSKILRLRLQSVALDNLIEEHFTTVKINRNVTELIFLSIFTSK